MQRNFASSSSNNTQLAPLVRAAQMGPSAQANERATHVQAAQIASDVQAANTSISRKRRRPSNVSGAPPGFDDTHAHARVANPITLPNDAIIDVEIHPSLGSRRQMYSLGCGGFELTTHVITVMAGEDIYSRIITFCQQSTSSVSVISASGAISTVTFQQPTAAGRTVTYEGIFEILSLCGSFSPVESGGHQMGSLRVSLVTHDGRFIGGSSAGALTAATPVQVILGTFSVHGHQG